MLSISTQQTMETIQALRRQESGYRCVDYLRKSTMDWRLGSAFLNPENEPADAECRQKMANWCYSVVDYCAFNRETVAVSMSMLDRYLAANLAVLADRKAFQLVAMTSLYTAVKTHESEAMEPQLVASMSNGMYTPDEITETERSILFLLKFKMNPPTAMSFVRLYMSLIPEDAMREQERNAVMELAKFQCELAVHDYDFVTVNSSTIAFAALSNAVRCCDTCTPQLKCDFLDTLAKVASIDIVNNNEVINIQDKLCRRVQQSSNGKSPSQLAPKTSTRQSSRRGATPASSTNKSSSLVNPSASTFMKSFMTRFI